MSEETIASTLEFWYSLLTIFIFVLWQPMHIDSDVVRAVYKRNKEESGKRKRPWIKHPPRFFFGIAWAIIYTLIIVSILSFTWTIDPPQEIQPDWSITRVFGLRNAVFLCIFLNLVHNKIWMPALFGMQFGDYNSKNWFPGSRNRKYLSCIINILMLCTGITVLGLMGVLGSWIAFGTWIVYVLYNLFAIYLNFTFEPVVNKMELKTKLKEEWNLKYENKQQYSKVVNE